MGIDSAIACNKGVLSWIFHPISSRRGYANARAVEHQTTSNIT
jgi:hypothetical protein